MFGNLKKKFSNAIQEGISISESLQQQYRQRVNSTPSTPSGPNTPTSSNSGLFAGSVLGNSRRNSTTSMDLQIPTNLNMAAGCNLLAKYEDDWEAIHDANEVNTQKAAAVADRIEEIARRTESKRIDMMDLIACTSGIPTLLSKLQTSIETLQQLTVLKDTVETELERLENLCEECDLQEFMWQKELELSQYKQKKIGELELYRQKVAAEHQQKIRQHDERLRQIQRERQAVFDDAFRGDIEEYKQRGTLSKIQKEASQAVALEEVVLEDSDTKDALEEFLNG